MAKLNLDSAPNAQMIKDVQQKSAKEINTNVVVNLPISDIEENPDNELVFNMDDIKSLAKNISEDGFNGAIEVYKKDNGKYEISSGHRRFRAMQMLGKDSIPAIVCDEPSVTKKRRVLISSNINIRNMSPMDIARAIKYHYDTLLLESPDKKTRASENRLNALSEYFNMTVMNVTRYLKLNDLINEIQDLVAKRIIPWSVIISCADFDKEKQQIVFEEIDKYLQTHEKITGKVIENIINKNSADKPTVKTTSQPIDRQIYRIHRQLKLFSQENLVIADKDNLKKQISEIEDYIKAIKKKI